LVGAGVLLFEVLRGWRRSSRVLGTGEV